MSKSQKRACEEPGLPRGEKRLAGGLWVEKVVCVTVRRFSRVFLRGR